MGILIALLLSGCASQSVLPKPEEVKVTREKPKGCSELGKVTGSTTYATDTAEQALADMRESAANKGATHLVVKQYSSNRTSVTGIAYQCQ